MRKMIALLALAVFSSSTPLRGQVDPEHASLTAVLKDHVIDGLVDYPAIASDERFGEYLQSLSNTSPAALEDPDDRLAFWINAYNAFTIKLIIDQKPESSIREISVDSAGPWDIPWIEIAGETYSLNHIEHKIIRTQFDEARIHMALVCAAVSCPPLRSEAYVGERLDNQLDRNSRAFVLDERHNRYDAEEDILYLSELFQWYGEDFVSRYGSAEKCVLQFIGLPDVVPSEVRYLPYNWDLNRQ